MNIEACNNNIILKPVEVETSLGGGLIMPETEEKTRPLTAKVIAIGPGKPSIFNPSETVKVDCCKTGDIVLVPRMGTVVYHIQGEDYYIAPGESIIAILKKVKLKD